VAPTRRFAALDGYRAVAAVTVVVFHVLFLTGENVAGTWMGNLASRLDVAVALFFLLSGFLLYRPWALAHLSPEPATRGPRVPGYLWHRALRILPAYWLLVAVALLTTLRGQRSAVWLSTLTMTEVYRHPLPTGLEQTWSLAAEVVFYLLLPVFAFVLLRPRRRSPRRQLQVELTVLLVLAVVGVVTQGLVESGWPWVPTLAGSWFIAYLAWFAAGMAMAVLHAWVTLHPGGRLRVITDEVGRNWALCWALAAVLLVLTLTPVAGSHASESLTSFEAVARNVLYCAVATAFMFPGVFGPQTDGTVVRLMSAPVLAYLGLISYGIFLWHLILTKPVIELTGHRLFDGGSLPVLAITLIATIAVASASYFLVEEPALRLKSRVAITPDAETAASASAGFAPDDPDVGVGVEAQA
jgi:peptidoglycan/LPS O-acetylase OafA/YrhL